MTTSNRKTCFPTAAATKGSARPRTKVRLLRSIINMPAPPSRLAIFQESVIREMTRLANQHQAINLAQGFPDFDPPEALIAALEKSARGPFHQYSITWGSAPFRKGLAAKIHRFAGL